jgi:hypothetical protein
LKKAAVHSQNTKESSTADRKFEKEFENLENEWEKRRVEMLETRNELAKIREKHGQRIVDHIIPAEPSLQAESNQVQTQGGEGPLDPISPMKNESFPRAEVSSIQMEKNNSFGNSHFEHISQISPIKLSPTKSELSPTRSVQFDLPSK